MEPLIAIIAIIAFCYLLYINNKQQKDYNDSLSRLVNQRIEQEGIRSLYPERQISTGGYNNYHPLGGVTINDVIDSMLIKRKRHKEKITMRKRIRGNRKVVDVRRKLVKKRGLYV
jgi:hypothetical protein